MTYRRTLHIEAPVEKVFGLFKDPNSLREFAPEGIDLTAVHLTQEGLGTHYTWSAKLAGLTLEGLDVFTEFVPNERIVDWSSNSLEGTWTYTFQPEGSGTRLTVENRSRALWGLWPLAALLDRQTATTHDPVFEHMKATLEEEASGDC